MLKHQKHRKPRQATNKGKTQKKSWEPQSSTQALSTLALPLRNQPNHLGQTNSRRITTAAVARHSQSIIQRRNFSLQLQRENSTAIDPSTSALDGARRVAHLPYDYPDAMHASNHAADHNVDEFLHVYCNNSSPLRQSSEQSESFVLPEPFGGLHRNFGFFPPQYDPTTSSASVADSTAGSGSQPSTDMNKLTAASPSLHTDKVQEQLKQLGMTVSDACSHAQSMRMLQLSQQYDATPIPLHSNPYVMNGHSVTRLVHLSQSIWSTYCHLLNSVYPSFAPKDKPDDMMLLFASLGIHHEENIFNLLKYNMLNRLIHLNRIHPTRYDDSDILLEQFYDDKNNSQSSVNSKTKSTRHTSKKTVQISQLKQIIDQLEYNPVSGLEDIRDALQAALLQVHAQQQAKHKMQPAIQPDDVQQDMMTSSMITDADGRYLTCDLTLQWDGPSSFKLENVLKPDLSAVVEKQPDYLYSFPFSYSRDLDFQRGMQETIESLHQGHYILYQAPIHGSSGDIYHYYDRVLLEEGVKLANDDEDFYRDALLDLSLGHEPEVEVATTNSSPTNNEDNSNRTGVIDSLTLPLQHRMISQMHNRSSRKHYYNANIVIPKTHPSPSSQGNDINNLFSQKISPTGLPYSDADDSHLSQLVVDVRNTASQVVKLSAKTPSPWHLLEFPPENNLFFRGNVDFIVKVGEHAHTGQHIYELWDTKLRKDLSTAAVLQTLCYASLLNYHLDAQGKNAKITHVAIVSGLGKTTRFALNAQLLQIIVRYIASYCQFTAQFHPLHPPPLPISQGSAGNFKELAQYVWDNNLLLPVATDVREGIHSSLTASGYMDIEHCALAILMRHLIDDVQVYLPTIDGYAANLLTYTKYNIKNDPIHEVYHLDSNSISFFRDEDTNSARHNVHEPILDGYATVSIVQLWRIICDAKVALHDLLVEAGIVDEHSTYLLTQSPSTAIVRQYNVGDLEPHAFSTTAMGADASAQSIPPPDTRHATQQPYQQQQHTLHAATVQQHTDDDHTHHHTPSDPLAEPNNPFQRAIFGLYHYKELLDPLPRLATAPLTNLPHGLQVQMCLIYLTSQLRQLHTSVMALHDHPAFSSALEQAIGAPTVKYDVNHKERLHDLHPLQICLSLNTNALSFAWTTQDILKSLPAPCPQNGDLYLDLEGVGNFVDIDRAVLQTASDHEIAANTRYRHAFIDKYQTLYQDRAAKLDYLYGIAYQQNLGDWIAAQPQDNTLALSNIGGNTYSLLLQEPHSHLTKTDDDKGGRPRLKTQSIFFKLNNSGDELLSLYLDQTLHDPAIHGDISLLHSNSGVPRNQQDRHDVKITSKKHTISIDKLINNDKLHQSLRSYNVVVYHDWWCHTPEQEAVAFQEVINFIKQRKQQYPKMHVYHYAGYESTAFRQTSKKYNIAVDDVKEMCGGPAPRPRLYSHYNNSKNTTFSGANIPRQPQTDNAAAGAGATTTQQTTQTKSSKVSPYFIDVFQLIRSTLRTTTRSQSLKEVEKLALYATNQKQLFHASQVSSTERDEKDANNTSHSNNRAGSVNHALGSLLTYYRWRFTENKRHEADQVDLSHKSLIADATSLVKSLNRKPKRQDATTNQQEESTGFTKAQLAKINTFVQSYHQYIDTKYQLTPPKAQKPYEGDGSYLTPTTFAPLHWSSHQDLISLREYNREDCINTLKLVSWLQTNKQLRMNNHSHSHKSHTHSRGTKTKESSETTVSPSNPSSPPKKKRAPKSKKPIATINETIDNASGGIM